MTAGILVPEAVAEHRQDWQAIGLIPCAYNPKAALMPPQLQAEVLIDATGPGDALLAALRQMPRLRLIQTLYAGVEAWRGLVPEGVLLSNGSGAHGGPTAEIATAGLLSLYRDLPGFAASAARQDWDTRFCDTVTGKEIMVIGAGDVGGQSARQLSALGARVQMAARTARAGVLSLTEAMAARGNFDVIVLALPLTTETRGLVDAGFLAGLKEGAVLINIGRGPLVVTDALTGELKAGRLRAVLDVTDPEPLPQGHPLWTAPGLVLTPHVGGSVRGAHARAMAVAYEQIRQFRAGKQPQNTVSGF